MFEILKTFFSFKGGIGFKMFGKTHIITLLIFLIAIYLLYKYSNELKAYKYKNYVPYIVAIILVMNRIIFCTSLKLNNMYRWKTDLPLHFCFIAAYVFVLAVITKSKIMYKISYYFSIAGPLVAVIMPNTTQNTSTQLGPDRYIYYQFVIAHHLLILANLYVLWVLDMDIKYKDAKISFFIGNILVFFVNIFNFIFGTNYSMLKQIPKEAIDALPCLSYGPPILWLEIGAMLMVMIAMIPIAMKEKKKIDVKLLQEAY